MSSLRVTQRLISRPPATRIERAVARSRRDEDARQRDLEAHNVFGSIVMYTPRGIHGTEADLVPHYPVERTRYPGLAASAREAEQLNAQQEEEARKQRQDWLDGKTTRKCASS